MAFVNKELHWTLAKVLNLSCLCITLQRTRYRSQVHVFFESVRLEKVVSELSTISVLAVTEDEINPFVKVCTNVV